MADENELLQKLLRDAEHYTGRRLEKIQPDEKRTKDVMDSFDEWAGDWLKRTKSEQ